MVLENHIVKLLQELGRLFSIELVDLPGECPNGKNALPASHWIRTYNGVHSCKSSPDVLWAASGLGVDLDLFRIRSCCVDEALTDERCSQSLQELLVWFGEAII